MTTATLRHSHLPLYRVGPRRWIDPTDASFSRTRAVHRWNTPQFPALYRSCSERVAQQLVHERLRWLRVDLDDLTPDAQPQLAEIDWSGTAVDMASEQGITDNGFPATYPAGVTLAECQRAATTWHTVGNEGVVCRSGSMHRLGSWGRPTCARAEPKWLVRTIRWILWLNTIAD